MTQFEEEALKLLSQIAHDIAAIRRDSEFLRRQFETAKRQNEAIQDMQREAFQAARRFPYKPE
jgi:glucose-6-phosphate-specific signal transduction histidine kinase